MVLLGIAVAIVFVVWAWCRWKALDSPFDVHEPAWLWFGALVPWVFGVLHLLMLAWWRVHGVIQGKVF